MIFNFWALIPIVLIVFSILGLDYMFPDFVDGPYGNLTASLIVVVVGGLTELCRIPGRIFFMPVWLLGLIMVSVHVFLVWGWFGLVAPVMLLVAGIVWLFKKVKQSELKRWATAKESLAELNSYSGMKNDYSFWKLISTCLYLPGINRVTEEICFHNVIVLDAALLVLAESSDSRIKQDCENLRDYFSSWPKLEKKPTYNLESQKAVEDFLKQETQDGDGALKASGVAKN